MLREEQPVFQAHLLGVTNTSRVFSKIESGLIFIGNTGVDILTKRLSGELFYC